MRQLSKREQIIFGICLTLAGVYVLVNGVVKPFRERISGIDGMIERKEREYNKDMRLIQKAKVARKRNRSALSQFEQTKSSEQVMATILSDIEKVAQDLKLQISDLKPKRVKEGEFFNHFSVSLTLNSEFSKILHFIYKLQNQPYEFNIEEAKFDRGARTRAQVVRTNLTLKKVLVPGK